MVVKIEITLWILTYNVASDTHEVVKHMITLQNTFAWYGEQFTQGVYVCINSISIVKLSKILVDSSAIVGWQIYYYYK